MMLYRSSPARKNLAIVGVAAFLILVLLSFVVQRPATLVGGSLICAIYALAACRPVRIRSDHLLAVAGICVLFIPAFLKPYHGVSPMFYFFSTLSVFFAAKAVARHQPEVILSAFRLMFTVALLAISLALYTYWGHPEPFGEVIEGSSTNGIPAYLIVIQIGLSLSNYLVGGRLPILSPVLTGVVAFFGNGRGSLVVAGLIIFASVMFNLVLARSTSRSRQAMFVLFFIGCTLALVWQWEEWLELLLRYTKLSAGLVDANRLEIWDDYVRKITPWTLLIGADYQGTVIEHEYLGNPHIAYIRTHSFFGLLVTLLALISPLIVFFSRKAWSARMVFFCLISLAALRAISEPILFPTLLDLFYFLYFFLFFRYAPLGHLGRAGDFRHVKA